MLNIKILFIIHIDHKLLVRFCNIDYYENIFAHRANKLCVLNIYIQHIPGKQYIVEEGLSYVIFYNPDCFPN